MYQLWVFIHLLGVFGFLLSHGVSVSVTFKLRNERDPGRINALLQLSGTSIQGFYISLVVLLIGGFAAATVGHLWSKRWIWFAVAVLVLASLAMYRMARPFYRRVGFVARAMEGGSEAVTEEQFTEILRSPRPWTIAWVGFGALAIILYLMVFKPSLGQGGGQPVSGAQGATCAPSGTTLNVVAKNLSFGVKCLAAPAGQTFTIDFDNQDGAPHNVAIYTDKSRSKSLFVGDRVDGPKKVTYQVPAITAGTYYFVCDFHAFMNGTFIAASVATPTTSPSG
ncbi:MAG TPA: cupredoxin domain-containing protein [Actinomycetota bacterium]|nr:cupredoxin domain-containing protein [Actinomycetota bacterium]